VEIANAYGDFVAQGLACDPKTHTPGHRRLLAALPPGLEEFEVNGAPGVGRRRAGKAS
jgi:hypothetical protein